MTQELGLLFPDQSQYRRISAEAEFGLAELAPYLDKLQPGAHVLEVGSGTGLLAVQVLGKCNGVTVDMLEPLGSGFSAFETAMEKIAASNDALRLHRETAEAFDPGDVRYDLIYSVNVFEHMEDWRLSLTRLSGMLKPDGRMVILCPNYTVPYESHFGIPLIFGAAFSRRLFARRIEHVERVHDADGLWASLNFIKSTQLSKAARKDGLCLEFDKSIMPRMLDRLTGDAEFVTRQGRIGRIAKFANAFGAQRVLRALPPAFLPYMKVVVTR